MRILSLKAILLDNDENFIKFLDSDLISLTETCEQEKLNFISLNYKIDDVRKAKELFKVGHKIWVNGDDSLKNCLYVINESLKNDFFSENDVEFDAEDVLTELNYAPLFSHTYITSERGFTIDSKGAVLVDRTALTKFFGDYYTIGVMQDCLTPYLQKISPVGTMTLMELLRYIEEETSNVFYTRYEKDKNSNKIHKYLDFLNPKSKKDSWNLSFDYHVPQEYADSDSSQIQSLHEDFEEEPQSIHDESYDEGDRVSFEKDDLQLVDVTTFQLNIIEKGNIIKSLSASEIGLNGRSEEYTLDFNYSENENKEGNLNINVIGYSYDENLAVNPNATTYMSETDNNPAIDVNITLGNEVTIQLYNPVDNIIEHEQTINPILNKTVKDVLDLGFNVENVTFETDETDTFKAVAPILSLSEDGTNSLNKSDLTKIINNWTNLEVQKGDIIPMIVERVSLTPAQINALGTYNLSNNYHVRPLKPNDSTDSSEPTYEYLVGTAYWKAPFSKISDEIYVADDEDTGVEYDHVNGKADIEKDVMNISTPKMGTVETSDEDVYSIFNDVCMKLKDKRFPDLNIEADVKNFNNNRNNSYNIYDKVYVKLPTCDELVIATVNKTVKNAFNIGENKVELSNYSNTVKAYPARTVINGDNVSFSYPNNVSWEVELINIESEAETSNKLITCTLLKVDENNNSQIVNSYNLETDNEGKIHLTLSYEPGTYQMKVNFGGDAELAAASSTFDINVYGTIIKSNNDSIASASKKKNTTTKTKRSYYNKYGVSPDEKSILAIGKASSKNEKKKYGSTKFYKVKFVRKCRHCGSTKLYWGWNWGSKFRGKTESGSSTGRIICDKCGSSYTIFGEGGKHDLTRIDAPVKSSKTEANTLKKGKYIYDKWTITVKPIKVSGNSGGNISRSASSSKTISGLVSNDVKKEALKIVKDKTGVKAAKAIIKWIRRNIKTESREGFYQSPSRTLSRRKGNDCCKSDLFMHMLDAAGVMKSGIACYYVYVHKKTKKKGTLTHVFCKINGKWVDPMMKHPWGHYKTGYGAVKKAKITRYPHLPFSKKY